MLNAFRHHGERDNRGESNYLKDEECSTPSGITASGTKALWPGEWNKAVLNAFRHHGERDRSTSPSTEMCTWCSTPSGITASGTRCGEVNVVPRWCSTPSGITASGTASASF